MNFSTQEDTLAGGLPAGVAVNDNPGSKDAGPASPPPTIVIEPTQKWASLQLREIWEHRELLYFLVWRDLKVRYKQTALGVVWVLLQPLLMTIVFTAVLGRLVRVPSEKVPYALFAYSGLTLWIFFSGAVSITGNCLVQNANLITKVYFPRLIVPLASILARLVDLLVSLVILGVLMFYYRVGFSSQIVMVPVLVLLLSALALAFGLWTSAVNVKYRDVGLALPVLIQLWMFLSPVVYPASQVPEKYRLFYSLNPLVGLLDGFRAALFGTPFTWYPILVSTIITLVLLPYAAYVFVAREKTFADII
ncbi:MAG TPA: ABC transporter permease [Pyrinomonadaceae bacterium]|nr:ABC transporter permease [Pyrinomonadaceae bacterium]